MEQSLVDRCRGIETSTWSDALDDLGIDGVIRGIEKRSGQGRFAAYAVTVQGTVGELGAYPLEDFAVAQMIAAVSSGEVLMVDLGGAEVSTFGGMAALSAVSRKFAAVVIDGGCRDIDDVRSTGLWLASRSVTPLSGKRRIKLHSIGKSAVMGGVTIQTGDAVIGDATGIVAIPRAAFPDALKRAEDLHALDGKIEKAIKDGKTLAEAVKLTGYV